MPSRIASIQPRRLAFRLFSIAAPTFRTFATIRVAISKPSLPCANFCVHTTMINDSRLALLSTVVLIQPLLMGPNPLRQWRCQAASTGVI
jgi:hypothetical protein